MKKEYLLFALLVSSLFMNGQTLQNKGFTFRFSGDGNIGNENNFVMELDIIEKVIYLNGCISKYYYEFTGNYYSDSTGVEKVLVGRTEEDYYNFFYDDSSKTFPDYYEITLTELDTNYNKTGTLKGFFKSDTCFGTRVDLVSKEIQNFSFNHLKNSFSNPFVDWHLIDTVNTTINYQEGNVPYISSTSTFYNHYSSYLSPISSDIDQNEIEILSKKIIDDTLFLFMKVSLPMCEHYNCRGVNCGGVKKSLVLYKISEFEIYSKTQMISDYSFEDFYDYKNERITTDEYSVTIHRHPENKNIRETYEFKIDLKNIDKSWLLKKVKQEKLD